MAALEDYLNRITSLHRKKPNFVATVQATVAPLVDLQANIAGLPGDFDLDVAVGPQLDATGAWAGSYRFIPEPLPNLWFSFDTLHKGFEEGFWKGPFDVGTLLERLDDETFRRLIRAKIMANDWDGTIPSAQAAMVEFFNDPETFLKVEDNAYVATTNLFFSFDDAARGFDGPAVWFTAGAGVSTLPELDMSVTVAVAGKIPSIVYLEILAQGLIPLSIGGVDQEISVTSVDRNSLFGFDIENQYVSGFEVGAWGVKPEYLVSQLT